jgi:hypothetical protein
VNRSSISGSTLERDHIYLRHIEARLCFKTRAFVTQQGAHSSIPANNPIIIFSSARYDKPQKCFQYSLQHHSKDKRNNTMLQNPVFNSGSRFDWPTSYGERILVGFVRISLVFFLYLLFSCILGSLEPRL